MSQGLPVALVLGCENFVARKLVERLRKDEIEVIMDDVESLESGTVRYFFDFEGKGNAWEKAGANNTKTTVVVVNDEKKTKEIEERMRVEGGDIRMVAAFGVYGPRMEGNEIIAGAFESAVKNKNLVLPSLSMTYRLLAVDDLVEAILRASFISGTAGEIFIVEGEEINSQEVAKTLIDAAKMTKNQVIQNEIQVELFDKNVILDNWRKLRWRPEIEFKDGIEETLQYFFVKVDEESRRKKEKPLSPSRSSGVSPLEKGRATKRFEVEVEEGLNPFVPPSGTSPFDKGERLEQPEQVEEVADEPADAKAMADEPKFEIKPIIKKQRIEPAVAKAMAGKEETVEEVEDIKSPSPAEQGLSPLTKGEQKTKQPRKKRRWVKWVVMAGILFLLYLPVKWGISLVSLAKTISKSEQLIKTSKFDQAVAIIDKQTKKVMANEEQITEFGLNRIGIFRNIQEIFRMGKSVLNLEKKAVEVGEQTVVLNEGLFGDEKVSWAFELNKLFQLLLGFEEEIGMLEARVSGNAKWLPKRFKKDIDSQLKELIKTRENITILRHFFPVIPELIGTDGKRREYLVLLQNEMELRATGGFIGSFGILGFQDGKMLNFEIKDVYDADGQMEGHVEPPSEIKEYLGEAAWFLRDANWQADFVGAAKDLRWFLEKEIGRKVDGVIGMNLAVAKAILGVVGEVTVPDYKEKINEGNLYEQAEFYSEDKFFPGSGQKASFLSGLGKQLFEEIKDMNSEKRLKLMEVLIEKLAENEMQIALNNADSAQIIASLGWDGSIKEGKCATERCVADYTYVNESNFGVNKANYFILREIEKTVEIGSSRLARVLKINYENTAKSMNYPGGNYRNYLRVYLPKDINLESIKIIDGENKSNIEIVEGAKLKMEEKYGKKELGFLVTVPVSGKKTVEIKYFSEITLNSDTFSYLDYIQRQPGSGKTDVVVMVGYPQSYQPMQVEPVATVEGDKIVFETKLERDLKIGVEVGR